MSSENKRRVENELIMLDYAEFVDTEFFQCRLVYKGGRPPSMKGCDFIECEFIFEDAAENTLQFISSIARGAVSGRDFVIRQLLGLG
jgi:hypothetical protein